MRICKGQRFSKLLEVNCFTGKLETPVPEVKYYLDSKKSGEELVADLAWPLASTPITILNNDQIGRIDEWKSLGWRVPEANFSVDKILTGLQHYFKGKDQ